MCPTIGEEVGGRRTDRTNRVIEVRGLCKSYGETRALETVGFTVRGGEVFGYLGLDWQKYVEIDPRYFRPTEVDVLMGDASKAKKVLGWEPKIKFKELARLMTDADMQLAEQEKVIRDNAKSE